MVRKPRMQTGKRTKNKITSPSNRSEFEFGSDKIFVTNGVVRRKS